MAHEGFEPGTFRAATECATIPPLRQFRFFFFFFNFINWLIMIFGSDYYNISWNITNDVLLYENFILEYFPPFWEKIIFWVEKSWKKLKKVRAIFFHHMSWPEFFSTFFNFFHLKIFFFSQNQGKYSKLKSSYRKPSFVIFHHICNGS